MHHLQDKLLDNGSYYLLTYTQIHRCFEALLRSKPSEKDVKEAIYNCRITATTSELHLAIRCGCSPEVVECLIWSGADVNAVHNSHNSISVAINSNHVEIVRLLMRHNAHIYGYNDQIPIMDAIQRNYVDIVEELLLPHLEVGSGRFLCGIDPDHKYTNCNNHTAMLLAITSGRSKCVELLHKYGGDINPVLTLHNYDHDYDHGVVTLIEYAMPSRHINTVKTLVKLGSTIHIGTLTRSLGLGNFECFRYLFPIYLRSLRTSEVFRDINKLLVTEIFSRKKYDTYLAVIVEVEKMCRCSINRCDLREIIMKLQNCINDIGITDTSVDKVEFKKILTDIMSRV
jgi:hypothetical protein